MGSLAFNHSAGMLSLRRSMRRCRPRWPRSCRSRLLRRWFCRSLPHNDMDDALPSRCRTEQYRGRSPGSRCQERGPHLSRGFPAVWSSPGVCRGELDFPECDGAQLRRSTGFGQRLNQFSIATRLPRRRRRPSPRPQRPSKLDPFKGDIRLKYLDIRDGIKPGRVVDEGCAHGALLAEISRDFPDSDLFGIDLSSEFAGRFHERQRAGEFGGAYVHFFHRNLFDRIFEPDSIDTTHLQQHSS